MTLTSAQILSAITLPRRAMAQGKLEWMRREADHRQRGLIEELADASVHRAQVYANPTTYRPSMEQRRDTRGGRTNRELSPADLLWLQRLPTDPERVTDDDARTLSAMAAEVAPPGDKRLVKSIFDPVRRLHDRRQAEAELANLRAATPRPVPSAAQSVLADAILSETPGLTTDEAMSRARAAIQTATAEQHDQRDTAIAQAQARIDAVHDETVTA